MNTEDFNNELRQTINRTTRKYAPLSLTKVEFQDALGATLQGQLQIGWMNRNIKFDFRASTRSAPSAVRSTLKGELSHPNHLLVVVPYISTALAALLHNEQWSALDLNGNYLIQTPEFLATRLDIPNQFADTRAIKKVFAGNSSIVGRFLMSTPEANLTVGEIHRQIEEQGVNLAISTVSKVISALAEDLIVEKSPSGVRLLQPDTLLTRLRQDYREPQVLETVRIRLPESAEAVDAVLSPTLSNWMWAGETSAERHSSALLGPVRTIFTTDANFREKLSTLEDARFYNCVVKRTTDAFIYFGRDQQWASELESCLVLSQLDKREREIAEGIAKRILGRFK